MVVKNSRKKSTAQMKAKKARSMGFEASVFKKKSGYGTSVTRMSTGKSSSFAKGIESRRKKLRSGRVRKLKSMIGGVERRSKSLRKSRGY